MVFVAVAENGPSHSHSHKIVCVWGVVLASKGTLKRPPGCARNVYLSLYGTTLCICHFVFCRLEMATASCILKIFLLFHELRVEEETGRAHRRGDRIAVVPQRKVLRKGQGRAYIGTQRERQSGMKRCTEARAATPKRAAAGCLVVEVKVHDSNATVSNFVGFEGLAHCAAAVLAAHHSVSGGPR